jgi:DNA-directed RNA polymerase subunit K/omega
MPKATSTAIEEFLEGKLNYRRREETDEKVEL